MIVDRSPLETNPLVENPDVSVLAPGGLEGSTPRTRSAQTLNLSGRLAETNPGPPSGPFAVSAESMFRQEGS